MIIKMFRKFLSLVVSLSLIAPGFVWAEEPAIDLKDLALPSEVKEMNKQPGAVFYSATAKNKTLMPVHFWGEVGRPGLHYIPVDTKLVKGLSFAGGGSSSAKLDEVIVNRVMNGKIGRKEFDLESGGSFEAHEYTLLPGDTVFVEKDRFYENRAYYTSLVAVIATIISSIFIIKRIEDMDRK